MDSRFYSFHFHRNRSHATFQYDEPRPYSNSRIWVTGTSISKDAFEVKVNYIRWTLLFKRNGVICLPIFIAWRTWGLKILEGWYWNLTRKRKTEKKRKFCSESCGSLRPPLPTQSHATRLETRPTLPSVPPDQKKVWSFWEEEHIYLEDLLESRLWKEHTQPIWACPRLAIPMEESFPAYWFITDWTGNACFYSFSPSDEPWLSSCTESLGSEGIGGTGGDGRTTESHP